MDSRLRVVRVYHAGADPSHRARDRALLSAGVEVTLVVPRRWPGLDAEIDDVPAVRLDVRRPGDVNRHAYADLRAVASVVRRLQPDVVDIHEEPVSVAARQWLRAAGGRPVVMYTAQNLDKRWPPPFAQYERQALDRVSAFYACSAQAASVVRGKGFRGHVEVLPLGVEPDVFRAGDQRLPAGEVVLGLVGRLVPEKGVADAVRTLAAVAATRPARLVVVGEGPGGQAARALSAELGVADRCTWHGWCGVEELAGLYRGMHVVLVPSVRTARWVEQFGRVVVEGRASGAVPVVYASGALPEVVGDSGVVVAEGDVGALASATCALLETPERWTALRSVGLRATSRTTWSAVADAQTALYERARRAPARPARRPSAATRREAAAEFGPPALARAGARPFALPVLREPGRGQAVLGQAVDAFTRQR